MSEIGAHRAAHSARWHRDGVVACRECSPTWVVYWPCEVVGLLDSLEAAHEFIEAVRDKQYAWSLSDRERAELFDLFDPLPEDSQ